MLLSLSLSYHYLLMYNDKLLYGYVSEGEMGIRTECVLYKAIDG